MIARPAGLDGTFVVELEPHSDDRGFFARAWCRTEFEALGLDGRIEQCNVAVNERTGTLRGLHFQRGAHAETKVVRCTAGAVYDVLVDLRPASSTYLEWIAVELSSENRFALYIPGGVAHGYQTLEERTEVFYFHSTAYAPESAGGVRWDDPAFGIDWPAVDGRVMSEKDRSWPLYDVTRPLF
jgi:dTDP-4-dehydrorhamnose 3,5-epimerase